MRHLIFKVLVVAVAFGLGEHALSVEPVQKPSTESMTVAQLEAAGDLARSQKDYAEAIKFLTRRCVRNRRTQFCTTNWAWQNLRLTT